MLALIKRLFVDCDDTLVCWTYGPALKVPDNQIPVPNDGVINLIHEMRRINPSIKITIWSLGGKEWARACARVCIPELDVKVEDRWPRIGKPGDLYVDDDPFEEYAHMTIHPEDVLTSYMELGRIDVDRLRSAQGRRTARP